MFEVLHPTKNELITHPEYVQLAAEHGYLLPNDYIGGRCPVCKRHMKVRGGHKKDDGHFYHNDKLFCSTKDPAARAYIGKSPTQVDYVAEAQNLAFAKDNIDSIWGKLNELVPYLDLKEFIDILKESRRLNIYGYAGLRPELLPYVYVTIINFLPSRSKGKQRLYKFCFFYESTVVSYDELWIARGAECQLIRVSYDGGLTKRVKIFTMEDEYLMNSKFSLSDKQKDWVLSFF